MQYAVSGCDFHNMQMVEWSYGDGDNASNCETPLPHAESTKCDHVSWHSGECANWWGLILVVVDNVCFSFFVVFVWMCVFCF